MACRGPLSCEQDAPDGTGRVASKPQPFSLMYCGALWPAKR